MMASCWPLMTRSPTSTSKREQWQKYMKLTASGSGRHQAGHKHNTPLPCSVGMVGHDTRPRHTAFDGLLRAVGHLIVRHEDNVAVDAHDVHAAVPCLSAAACHAVAAIAVLICTRPSKNAFSHRVYLIFVQRKEHPLQGARGYMIYSKAAVFPARRQELVPASCGPCGFVSRKISHCIPPPPNHKRLPQGHPDGQRQSQAQPRAAADSPTTNRSPP